MSSVRPCVCVCCATPHHSLSHPHCRGVCLMWCAYSQHYSAKDLNPLHLIFLSRDRALRRCFEGVVLLSAFLHWQGQQVPFLTFCMTWSQGSFLAVLRVVTGFLCFPFCVTWSQDSFAAVPFCLCLSQLSFCSYFFRSLSMWVGVFTGLTFVATSCVCYFYVLLSIALV
jgi:hypothetical protein